MTIITLPHRVKKNKGLIENKFKWCYIGRDIAKREAIATKLGAENRLYLKDKLHKVTKELRQGYLDFVAELGKDQEDQLNWWASKFASKSPLHTDFFLLLSYAMLIEELIHSNKDCLFLIIEDIWLFKLLKVKYALDINKKIIFRGIPFFMLHVLSIIVGGALRRIGLFFYLIMIKIIFSLFSYKNVLKNEFVAILSYIDRRGVSTLDGKYQNFYIGENIAPFLESKGFTVRYLAYLHIPVKQIRSILKNRSTIIPLVNYLKVSSIFKTLFAIWKPKLKTTIINNTSVNMLLKRELLLEFRSIGFNLNLMWHNALSNFFLKESCRSLLYNFENQPFEKIMCMAAKMNPKVKTVGYRNSSAALNYLSMYLGRGEKDFMPLPHRIITLGKFNEQLLKEYGGYPKGLIKTGGAWRYIHILDEAYEAGKTIEQDTVLLVLPSDILIAQSLICNIINAFHNEKQSLKFIVKPHPLAPFNAFNTRDAKNIVFTESKEPIAKLLEKIDTVIYSSSTVGIEALVNRKKVIRYLAENRINIDPLDGIDESLYVTFYDGDSSEIIFEAIRHALTENISKRIDRLKKEYFGNIDYDLWVQEV